jgi:hypothetical protein
VKLRSTATFLGAGIAFIVAVNAVVLIGVRYNRAEPPDSALLLSERELKPVEIGSVASEDSGLNLSLQVRTLNVEDQPEAADPAQTAKRVARRNGVPWLDAAKMRALGFPDLRASDLARSRRGSNRLLPKDVYVVLEFDGPGYQRELAQSIRAAELDEQRAQADPADQRLAERARYSRRSANFEREQGSRLYCVDAGLDRAALRKTYADQTHYAIVRGTIGVSFYSDDNPLQMVGSFLGVRIDEINVPLAFRAVFANAAARPRVYPGGLAADALETDARYTGPRYDVSVAWGRRLEPWIRSAAAHQP